MKNKRAFTLIEILVVISIIALLSSVVLGSLNRAKVRSNNAYISSMLMEYAKALELYYSNNGTYPPTTAEVCLGEGYPSGTTCGTGATYAGDPNLRTALSFSNPVYIPGYPPIGKKLFSFDTSTTTRTWVGATYSYRTAGKFIKWVLEGTNLFQADCPRPPIALSVTGAHYNDGVLCQAFLP